MKLFGGVISISGVTFMLFCIFCVIFLGYALGRIRIRGVDLGTAGVFIAALVFTIGLMLIGEWFIEETIVKFGFKALLVAVKMISQAAVLSLLFTVIYYFFPADKTVFSVHLPGAVLSACGWVIFTELYSIYVSLTDTGIYGSLSTVMLTMLWLYVCMYILLIGGEINVSLQKLRNG